MDKLQTLSMLTPIMTAAVLLVGAAALADEPAAPTAAFNPKVSKILTCPATPEYGPAVIGSVGYVVLREDTDDSSAEKQVKSRVIAFSINTGEISWSYSFTGRAAGGAAATMRSIFVTTIDGNVLALNRLSGKLSWQYNCDQRLYCSPTPAEPQGCECRNIFSKLVVATGEGKLICLDSRKGNFIWKSDGQTRINAPASRYKDQLLVADCDGLLRSILLTSGKQAYTLELPGPVGGSPRVVDDKAIIATATGAIVAIDLAKRKQLWKLSEQNASGAIEATPAISAGNAIVGGDNMSIDAINCQSGQRKWSYPASDSFTIAPVVSTAGIFAADDSGRLLLLDAETGTKIWSYDAGDEILGTAAIKNGLLFVTSDASIRVARW